MVENCREIMKIVCVGMGRRWRRHFEEVEKREQLERVGCLPAGLSVQGLHKGGQHIGLKLDLVREI